MSGKKYFVVFDDRCGRAVPDAKAVSDITGRIEQWNSGPKDRHVTDIIGTQIMLLAYRLAVAKGQLSLDDVQFFFDEIPLTITPLGQLRYQFGATSSEWPDGLCDVLTELTMELLNIQLGELES